APRHQPGTAHLSSAQRRESGAMQEQPPPDEEQREREEGRPDPEELLRRYGLRDRDLAAAPPPVALEGSTLARAAPAPGTARYPQRRGRLRVYLGAASGAGKTYA